MCIASKRLKELEELIRNIKSDYKVMCEQHSHYDKSVSEIYHKIETEKFDAARGYCLAKELQNTLRERRIIKHEQTRLHSLMTTLNVEHLHNAINKSTQNISKLQKKNKDYTDGWGVDGSFVDELVVH